MVTRTARPGTAFGVTVRLPRLNRQVAKSAKNAEGDWGLARHTSAIAGTMSVAMPNAVQTGYMGDEVDRAHG